MDLTGLINNAWDDANRERGHVNILIAGRTGVGKSTLINSTLEVNLAETGDGRPRTKNTREIKKSGYPISIFDTRGLELAEFSDTLGELEEFISQRSKDPDEKEHIHVAWVCISEDSRRVEAAETSLAEMLDKYVPVIGVITKSRADQGFRAKVQDLLPKARNVVRVRAIREEDDDGHVRTPMGLEELADLTDELIPEGQKRAFTASQKVSCKLKREQSQKIVVAAASASAAIGATPIPLADAALLIPTQVGMLAKISSVYNLSLSDGALKTMFSSIVGGSIATLTGRLIVGSFLKLIPGAGTVAGGVISAGTAAVMTIALGGTYISILDALCIKNVGDSPSEEEILNEVRKRFKRKRDTDGTQNAREEDVIGGIEQRFKEGNDEEDESDEGLNR